MNYTDQLDKILDRSFKGSYGSDGYISAKMDIEALIHKETQAARLDELFMINKMYRQRRDPSLIGMDLDELRNIDKDLDFIADRIKKLATLEGEKQ